MKFTKEIHPGDTTPATHSGKYYSGQELQKCLNNGSVSANAILFLIESHFEKDKTITELTQTVAELTKRIAYLEKDVGAGKNQLRNRYNKAKERRHLQKLRIILTLT